MNQVYMNDFSLEIQTNGIKADKIVKNGSNYFVLPNESEYKLKLGNQKSVKVDAHVSIDGEKVGIWRINKYSSITIERPSNINKKFVLLKEGTSQAKSAGIKTGDDSNGLIKIVFKPEKVKENIMYFNHISSCFNDSLQSNYSSNKSMKQSTDSCAYRTSKGYNNIESSGISPAGTALGDHSNQKFKNVERIYDYDDDNITTIYARLTVNDNYIAPKYSSLKRNAYETSIPPPLYSSFDY